ncbi:cupin domain-containing protein [Pseudonocardia sp. H11422]|uniref:cupin domain-containing protein n=1 Tax=Pseudonocardia sp. H11422 TaxID=2835866 RepID=UPI001BDD7356|nr:cupin domain-containing protein [Pseudonocardia sp. H11422]
MATTEHPLTHDLDPTVPAPAVDVSRYGFEGPFEEWADDARYFEYTKAANPLATGMITPVPAERFGAELYADGPTRAVPLDLASHLGIDSGPATSPGLLASFLRIREGESLQTAPNATSELYYVLRGRGWSRVNGRAVRWEKGDFLTLPAGSDSAHHADSDAAL